MAEPGMAQTANKGCPNIRRNSKDFGSFQNNK